MKNHSVSRLKALGFEPEGTAAESAMAEKFTEEEMCKEEEMPAGSGAALGFTRAAWKSVGRVAKTVR